MTLPTAPGRSYLKVTGIFYIITGTLSSISALLVRFIFLAKSLEEIAPDINFDLYHMATGVFPIWRFTAENIVFAILERLHYINPKIEPISDLISRLTINPIYNSYVNYLRYPSWSYSAGIVLTFLAVIIGMFLVFMGIMAVKHCEPSKHSKLLVIFASINLGMMAVSAILLISFFAFLGCAIAVLCLTGAVQNYMSYEKFYAKTDKTVYTKKIIKYSGITAASILCTTVLVTILCQPIAVRLVNDSKFYLNGDKDNAYIHIIDENHLQLIGFDMDTLTKNFEIYLGFEGTALEYIQEKYSGKIEFRVENGRIYSILPRYKGTGIDISMIYINENTILYRSEEYIKQ